MTISLHFHLANDYLYSFNTVNSSVKLNIHCVRAWFSSKEVFFTSYNTVNSSVKPNTHCVRAWFSSDELNYIILNSK